MRKNQIRNNKSRNIPLRAIGLIIVGLAAAVGLVWFLAQATDTTTTVILANEGNCPRALLQLQPRDGGGVITLVAGPGEQAEAEVAADIVYDYLMSTERPAGTSATEGRVCFDRDQGEIEVPLGGSFTYRVTSVTRPYIIFEVDAACPDSTIFLTALGDENREPIVVLSGANQEIEISPDRAYSYDITVLQLADPTANICNGVEGAQITLGNGESRTIRVEPSTD